MLYIMRHGRTDWNDRRKLQGRTDIPLNAEGRRAAEQAREEYRDVALDICYCSPLIRAKETAQIVLHGRGIPVIPDNRLREMSFGTLEGIENYYTDPDSPVSTLFQKPEAYTASAPGAESFEDLFGRTGGFLREVINPLMRQGRDVLIVGHWVMNLSIVCQVRHIPLARFWSTRMENCRLLRLL